MRYYLGLGGNLGDVAASMATAVETLRAQGYDVPLISSCYATAPMGGDSSARYLNTVLGVDASRSPIEMLRDCQEIEAASGRVRGAAWGPRTLDIDLLLADQCFFSGPALTLPHPGLIYRRFALDPLYEIAPDAWHPALKVDVRQLREWLLPRPLEVLLRTNSPVDVEALTKNWQEAFRSRIRLSSTSDPDAAAAPAGWLLDGVTPVSPTRPRTVSLSDLGAGAGSVSDPLERVGPVLAAMTDEPKIVPAPALDRVRERV